MSERIRAISLALFLAFVSLSIPARQLAMTETSAESQIRAVLENQAMAWSQGDIDRFMAGYWKLDETLFVSANGITRGWQSVLDRYRHAYPNRKAMGHLTFSNLDIHMVCPEAAFVVGQYQLERESDRPAGIFTLPKVSSWLADCGGSHDSICQPLTSKPPCCQSKT